MNFIDFRSDYRPTRFFKKYISAFIPPWYSDIASQITRTTRRPFTDMWSWAFDQIMSETETAPVVGEIGSYSSDIRGTGLPGATSRISEVYKSSFARTIDWFTEQQWMDAQLGAEYGLNLCPIDLSLWEISPVEVPTWWPTATADPDVTDISKLAEFRACEALVGTKNEEGALIAAEGAIPQLQTRTAHVWFRLLPCAYITRGKDLPGAASIAGFLRRSFWQKAPTGPDPLRLFAPSFDGWVPFLSEPGMAADLALVPLISRLECNNINLWQVWRGADRPLFPSDNLVEGGTPGSDSNSWFYQRDGKVLMRIKDWRIGNLETTNSHQYMLHGQFAFANTEWLTSALERNGCRLGYVLSVKINYSKTEYSKPEEVCYFKLLNVSAIVI